jgi:sec-independent protein translocase protein TatB
MFGIGTFEIVLVFAIALIILGPDRLPQAMGTVGRWVRELRRLTGEFRQEFDEEIKLLQSEIANLREEAELTRQELVDIHADIVETVSGVQEDLDEAGADIRAEFGMVGDALSGQDTVGAAASRPSSTQTAAELAKQPAVEPTDAMYRAIKETFSAANDQPAASPLPVVSGSPGTNPQIPTSATPSEATVNIGGRLDAMHAEVAELAGATGEHSVRRFSPQSEQFGALLKIVATAGGETLEKAKKELQRQAAADAIKLAHLNGKGPAGIALAWAAQRQSLVKDGSLAIDTSEEGRVSIRMHECPYGLKQESEVPICKLSNAYDLALAEQMGAVATYEMRMTTMHPYCELVVQTPLLAAKIAAAGLDGAKSAASSDEPAETNGAPEATEKVAAESE